MNLNRRQREIVEVFNAASDGTPQYLRHCLDRGFPYDRPCPYSPTQTIPINIAAQYRRADNLAVLATKAIEEGRTELLESGDAKGRSPAFLAVQKGHPECLGVMAKAGANLHRACPVTWEVPGGSGGLVDPDPEEFPLTHALNQTVLSFVTNTCCECDGNENVRVCGKCKMAKFCGAECQRKNWPLHKKVCKRIKAGADLVTCRDTMPNPTLTDEGGFPEQFTASDNVLEIPKGDREENHYDSSIVWEYYDIATEAWIRYPKEIHRGLEGISHPTFLPYMGPRYMFRPGDKEAEGKEEYELSTNPPNSVATNHAYFSHMIDHQIYTGAGRKMRRRAVG